VPVGGGVILSDDHIVVTQPQAGTFKGFSSTCTHQGCTVSKISNGTISCPCHGSEFAITDGSVKQGPATQPLPSVPVSVQGDEVTMTG
jgi:Rieske Fe-S protein